MNIHAHHPDTQQGCRTAAAMPAPGTLKTVAIIAPATVITAGRHYLLASLMTIPMFTAPASAQDIAADRALAPVMVTATRSALDPNLPTTTESRTAEQLRKQNFVNVEDALKYLPNLSIRKRYIGDRNSLIGGRSSSTLQPQRGLVYADGYLLSQFLGQYDAPRWNVVAPEELARIDVLYGPFSALYPGNSIGTTVMMTTRQPKKLEGSAKVQVFSQRYDDAGYADTYGGHQESAWLGNKVGNWSYSFSANRLQNKSQPMQYVTLKNGVPGSGNPVTGAVLGIDPTGKPWLLAGPNGSALEDSTQEQLKLKLGYDFSPALYGEVLYAYWHNDSKRQGATLLRDAAGTPVYAGPVSIDGVQYNLPASSFAPQSTEETHGMLGLKLMTRNRTGWNWSSIATVYDIGTDVTRSASVAPPTASDGGAGTYADNGGTGWKTLDLQSSFAPSGDEVHAPAFGYHVNRYQLESRSFNNSNWLHAGAQTPRSSFVGRTSLQALYLQDTLKLSSQWLSTLGLRYEQWKARDGSRATSSGAPLPYADRTESAWSPKASISYMPGGDLVLKASVGKGVRFPTVSELFQGSVSGGRIINNDAGLKPERSLAKELSIEQGYALARTSGTLRVSLFEDDVRDTILNQTNVTVFPNITSIQNIDRVRTRGVELSASARDVMVKGLDLIGNLAFSRAKILENSNNPSTEGKNWVRVPHVRASLVGSYRANERLTTSLAARHSGRQYANLDNSDINPNTFGAVSSFTVWDAKASIQLTKHFAASFGVDNLTDRTYWVYHPYPGRSFFGELHGSF